MSDTEFALEILQYEEADAWFEYRDAISGKSEEVYAETEQRAWNLLHARLRALDARRSSLEPAAA